MTVAPTSVHPGREQHRSRWVLVAILAFLLGGLAVALLYRSDVFGGVSKSTTGGSGVPATQVRHVADFDSVELAGSNNVVIRASEKQSVVVRADDNLLDRVTTEVQSGTLVVANTPGSLTTKSPMSVEVNVPTLTALTITGSGNIVVNGIDTASLEVAVPGSGTFTGSGAVTRLDVTVAGSGIRAVHTARRERRTGSRERLGKHLRQRDEESRCLGIRIWRNPLRGRSAARDEERHWAGVITGTQ